MEACNLKVTMKGNMLENSQEGKIGVTLIHQTTMKKRNDIPTIFHRRSRFGVGDRCVYLPAQ